MRAGNPCIVGDNGCGMNREVLEKIFIPFFTTKPHYQGTGLGLPVVQEIVAAHGGTVSVQSERVAAPVSIFAFPAWGQPERRIVMQAERHILIVDDSADTLEVLRRNLVGRGYRTTTAPSAEDASVFSKTPLSIWS